MAERLADDALERLRERIRATEAAAARLAEEAGRARRNGDQPAAGTHAAPGLGAEVQTLLGLLEALTAVVPRELAQQLRELVRQVLLTVRALIDWYLVRAEGDAPTSVEVQDIPIA